MEKDSTPAPPAENTTCKDIKGYEKALPTQSEDKKSVEIAASSLDEPSKVSQSRSPMKRKVMTSIPKDWHCTSFTWGYALPSFC